MTERKYKLYYAFDILDNYPIIKEYYIQLYLSHNGSNPTSRWTDSKVIVTMPGENAREYDKYVQGADSGGNSYFVFSVNHTFVKDSKIELIVNDVAFTANGLEKDMIVTAGLLYKVNNSPTFLLVNRLWIPFHLYSFVASSKNNKTITTCFTSSIGHHKSGYFTFKYPDCVTFDKSSTFGHCD